MTARRTRLLIALLLLIAAVPTMGAQQVAPAPSRTPDVIYVPTPPELVVEMLKLANVGPGDVVYDLGSGDGRIPITAVTEFGATRGVGIDIDPQRIAEANANARAAGVEDRVTFLNQDLFTSDFKDATVVTLFLLQSMNIRLRPRLRAELTPGTRIVSHTFDLGDWVPDRTIQAFGKNVFLWTISKR